MPNNIFLVWLVYKQEILQKASQNGTVLLQDAFWTLWHFTAAQERKFGFILYVLEGHMKKDAWNRNGQKIWEWTELLYVPLHIRV